MLFRENEEHNSFWNCAAYQLKIAAVAFQQRCSINLDPLILSQYGDTIKFQFCKTAYSYQLCHAYIVQCQSHFARKPSPQNSLPVCFFFFCLQCRVYNALATALSEQTENIWIQSHQTHVNMFSFSVSMRCSYHMQKTTCLQMLANEYKWRHFI